MKLHENIRALRKNAGLTQEQLAEALGVTVGAVSKWETELTYPDIGMLPVLAEFFDVSLDVLMGYSPQSNSPERAVELIKKFRVEKDYESGVREAERALSRYPDHFQLVYASAELYKLKGLEQGDAADHCRALELMQRAERLFSQNRDNRISILALHRSQAEIYPFLGQYDKALEILERDNFDGIHNCAIGMLLSENFGEDRRALRYISESAISCLCELFRDVITYANLFERGGELAKAQAVLAWFLGVIGPLSPGESVTAYTKMEVWLHASAAVIAAKRRDPDAAETSLRMACAAARRFDAAPDYSYQAVPFYEGNESARFYDNIGVTAMDSVEKILRQNGANGEALLSIWTEICEQEEQFVKNT